jgi:hypothetical protein
MNKVTPRSTLSGASSSANAQLTAGSQVDFVLLALLEAGGADAFVDIEDLAVSAYKLAPHLFRWRRYPQYPSAEFTRMALRHAEADGQNLFVRGAGGRARRFTVEGVKRAREAQARLRTDDVGPRTPSRPATRDLARMERHPALSKWRVSGVDQITLDDLADLLLCSPSSSATIFEDRLNASSAAASGWDRPDLVEFLLSCIASLDTIISRGHRDSGQ